MKIDRNNYEAFFLDYHEGNLSDGSKKDLFLFLENNPDLKEEFESFEMISLDPPGKKFLNKSALKRSTITVYNYKTWFIGFIENDLSEADKRELEQFLEKNPALKPELELFKRTRILPDHRIIFENKKQLKHGGKIIALTPRFYRIAVAATVALLLITYFFFRNSREQMIADHNNHPSLSIQKSPVAVDNTIIPGDKMKKKKKENRKENIRSSSRKAAPTIQPANPVIENNSGEPLLTQHNEQDAPKKPNVHEPADSSAKLFTENKIAGVKSYKPAASRLSEIFSEDELRELGVGNELLKKNTTLRDIAAKGASELAKVTGTSISVNRRENVSTYEVDIGSFSFSQTRSK